MARRISIFTFGVLSYALFFTVFLYAAGFMSNWLVPKSVDSGPAPELGIAIAVDLGLLGLFAVQHSVMARPAFKRGWTRIVPSEGERSVYVLASSLAMIALFAWWRPMQGVVWRLDGELARGIAWAGMALGVVTILYSTFLIDHFDLFGLRQAWLALRGRAYTSRPFGTPGLYKHIRHPLYVGWFLFFWCTPDMTLGHLSMALGTTAYILDAIVLEERDLLQHFGADYRAWRARTPLFIPHFGSKSATPDKSRGVAEAV